MFHFHDTSRDAAVKRQSVILMNQFGLGDLIVVERRDGASVFERPDPGRLSERFVPHLVLHEKETWVLADCRQLGEVMGDLGPAADLERIKRAYPQYAKTIDGPLVIAEAGLDAIRSTARTPTTGSASLRRECHARLRGDRGNTVSSNKCTAQY